MNSFIVKVSSIEKADNLNLVTFDFFDNKLSMVSLGLNDDIKIGTKVELATKPTLIALAKSFSGEVSFSNQLKSKIVSIKSGKLLSSVCLEFNNVIFESIITSNSCKKMDLKVDDEVIALIKASELSILKVLDA